MQFIHARYTNGIVYVNMCSQRSLLVTVNCNFRMMTGSEILIFTVYFLLLVRSFYYTFFSCGTYYVSIYCLTNYIAENRTFFSTQLIECVFDRKYLTKENR